MTRISLIEQKGSSYEPWQNVFPLYLSLIDNPSHGDVSEAADIHLCVVSSTQNERQFFEVPIARLFHVLESEANRKMLFAQKSLDTVQR